MSIGGLHEVLPSHGENSTTKPGAKALARWATVRGMGKREASSRLELLAS